MKKLIVAMTIAVSLAAPSAFAQAKNFEGLSITGNLNLISTTTEISLSSNSLNGLGQEATNASLQAAYSLLFSDTALLSIGGTYNVADVDAGRITAGGTPASLKIQNGMSLYVEPGILYGERNLGYAKVSYNRGTVKAIGSSQGSSAETSITQDITGIGFGFGLRLLLSRNSFLQVEVNRIQFGGARFAGDTTDFKVKSTLGSVGFGYKF